MVPAVADEVLAYCTSCKMDLNHVVVALKGAKIAKVQCLTCKKEHGFRVPHGATSPTTKSSRSKKAEQAESSDSSIEAEWEKLMVTHRDAVLKPYSIRGHFALGDKLGHPVFGEGIVGKLIYPNKLEVIFRTDVKILIYGGVSSDGSLFTPRS